MRVITAVLFVVLIIAAGSALIRSPAAPPVAAAEQMPRISIVRHFACENPRSMTFSADGRFLCVVMQDSTVNCYSSTGAKRYSTKVPGADSVVIASGGDYALAYARRNPSRRRLTFLDAKGNVHWKMDVAGAVWSADACRTEDGARFVIGTGERYVYVVNIGQKRKRYRRWRVPGAVVSLNIDREGEQITFGTWQRSCVGCASPAGNSIWQIEADPASLHYVRLLDSPERLLLRSIPNRSGADGEFRVLSARGERIWRGNIDCSQNTRVLASPDGRYVCLGYTKLIEHKGEFVREKHAALYDASGHRLWDKGSLFFEADPILTTSGGYVLVESGENALFVLGPTGDVKPSLKLPASVKRCVSSRDGRRALLYCSDGRLYILLIST